MADVFGFLDVPRGRSVEGEDAVSNAVVVRDATIAASDIGLMEWHQRCLKYLRGQIVLDSDC